MYGLFLRAVTGRHPVVVIFHHVGFARPAGLSGGRRARLSPRGDGLLRLSRLLQ